MQRGVIHAVALASAVLLAAADATAAQIDWLVRRNPANGTCSLQRSDAQPLMGRYVSEHGTRKEACVYAKSRHTQPARDLDECPAYAPGTVKICRLDGVVLPESAIAAQPTP